MYQEDTARECIHTQLRILRYIYSQNKGDKSEIFVIFGKKNKKLLGKDIFISCD